ncbi:TPA: AfaD family invasin [Escherichia coli]|uniref:AfaD family invasin n=1 Tax=Escherichia coli TaxID=562 RepID=UPI0019C68023|nr:AfaD family invasin [Escherichia coli]ELO4156176.1 hypothetical protein [Escherichia coli]MCV0639198.1 hypothetical protein [Escherichia coli]MDO2624942.1 AfaD family invasin [Escherichia coli]MDO2797116.1 AfaD family invasin [Escherichia coli]MEC6522761.1 AfaD family invasin [Escherichia coli]
MMRKNLFSLYLIISFALTVNAAEMNLESRMASERDLSDGDIIATGRVFCKENDISLVSLLNIQSTDDGLGNVYILQGKGRVANKLIVRIEGDGWHSSGEIGKGIYKIQKNTSEQFHVVVNGRQRVNPDVYTIKASSVCSGSR